MKNILLIVLFAASIHTHAQVFWTEDFGTGCSQGNVASTYTGTNGAWTIASTGTNDPYANQWYISATEAGMGANNCGSGCGIDGSLTNRTLHVSNVEIAEFFLDADPGASYNAGGACSFGYCVITNRRAESPTINCTGKLNITLAFNYMENGNGTSDDATLWYFDGTTWSLLQNIAKTPLTCAPQGTWTAYSYSLPASANNNANVKIGFNWVNNDDGTGTDPSFAVDDITVSAPVIVCSLTTTSTSISCNGDCSGTATAVATGTAPFSFVWNNGNTGDAVLQLCAGTYVVAMTDANNCTASDTVNITQPSALYTTDSVLENSCDSCFSGIAVVHINGGTPLYTIAWSNPETDTMNVYLNPGVYSYTVTDANGCTVVDSVEIQEIVGIAEPSKNILTIYPNPFYESTLLTLSSEMKTDMIFVLYDNVGKEIRRYDLTSQHSMINRNALSPGLYHYVVSNADRSIIQHGKLLLQ